MKKIRHVVFDHDGTLVDSERTGELYSGIEEMLDRLAQKGVKLYVWTARTRYSTVEFLKSLGIISRFEQLLCSTDTNPKPCVEGLADMLESADPGSVVVVGDGFADIMGAKNYGAYAIGALWASASAMGAGAQGQRLERHKEALEGCGADYLAQSVDDCKKKIFEFLE